jgi:deoxyadenosine/deoxycytidine kinase
MERFTILKPTTLVLCGVSGSGKSTLEKNLIADYPDLFYKLQQFSTRAMRPGERQGDPYIFIQRSTFYGLQDKLVGVLGMKEGSIFKDLYGSLPDFVNGKIATIILAEEGIEDLMEKYQDETHVASQYRPVVVGLDVNYEELSAEDRIARIGRDEEFIDKERQVLQHSDRVWRNGNGKYVNPKEIVEYLIYEGFIRRNTP